MDDVTKDCGVPSAAVVFLHQFNFRDNGCRVRTNHAIATITSPPSNIGSIICLEVPPERIHSVRLYHELARWDDKFLASLVTT
jgi:hypothetical protein